MSDALTRAGRVPGVVLDCPSLLEQHLCPFMRLLIAKKFHGLEVGASRTLEAYQKWNQERPGANRARGNNVRRIIRLGRRAGHRGSAIRGHWTE